MPMAAFRKEAATPATGEGALRPFRPFQRFIRLSGSLHAAPRRRSARRLDRASAGAHDRGRRMPVGQSRRHAVISQSLQISAAFFSCAVLRVALRRCSGARRLPGNDQMQFWHGARPSRDCRLCDAWRPRDDVLPRAHNVPLLVRDVRESCAPPFWSPCSSVSARFVCDNRSTGY